MSNLKSDNDTYSEADADARREATLKHMLTTPPKPQERIKGKRKESQEK